PGCVPVALKVVTVTEVPASSDATIVATLRVELSAVGEQTSGAPAQATFAVAVVMSMLLSGSSSQLPALPCGAGASTEALAPMFSVPLPEVSTQPPSPPDGPPLARMVPLNAVAPSDQTATVPPLPLPVALASMTAPTAMLVLSALRTKGSAP